METLKKYKWHIAGVILALFIIFSLINTLTSYLQNTEESYIKQRKELTQQIEFAHSLIEDWKNKYDSISVEKQKIKIVKIKDIYEIDSIKVSQGITNPITVIGVDDSCLSKKELEEVAITYLQKEYYEKVSIIQDSIIDTLEYKISIGDSVMYQQGLQIGNYQVLDQINQARIDNLHTNLKKSNRKLIGSKIGNWVLGGGLVVGLGAIVYLGIAR